MAGPVVQSGGDGFVPATRRSGSPARLVALLLYTPHRGSPARLVGITPAWPGFVTIYTTPWQNIFSKYTETEVGVWLAKLSLASTISNGWCRAV